MPIAPIIAGGFYYKTLDTTGSPGGSSGQLQYNNGGVFAGVSGGTWNGTAGTLDNFVIGGTTPAAGAFSTLSASGTVMGANFGVGAAPITNSVFYGYVASGPSNVVVQSGAGTWGILTVNSAGSPGFIWDASHAFSFATSSDNAGSGYSAKWTISASGHFLAGTDNTYDIGASGATRPRNVYVGSLIVTPQLAISGGGSFSNIKNIGNGIMVLYNEFETDFSRLQFGGTTSSFPALKRSAATLQARLADDSDYATFQAKTYSVDGTAGATGGTFTVITSITVKNGIVTAIAGS